MLFGLARSSSNVVRTWFVRDGRDCNHLINHTRCASTSVFIRDAVPGDVIIFHPPKEISPQTSIFGDDNVYIKRVVAVEGDTVEVGVKGRGRERARGAAEHIVHSHPVPQNAMQWGVDATSWCQRCSGPWHRLHDCLHISDHLYAIATLDIRG